MVSTVGRAQPWCGSCNLLDEWRQSPLGHQLYEVGLIQTILDAGFRSFRVSPVEVKDIERLSYDVQPPRLAHTDYYLLLTMSVGFWVKRYVEDLSGYLVAGRRIKVFLGVATLAATTTIIKTTP